MIPIPGHEGCMVPQPLSDTDGSVSSSYGIQGRNATPVKITSSGSMNQLLKQAGYLIQDEERAMSPKASKKKEKKGKKSKSKRSVMLNSSGNIIESSCDASGEETSNEGEFSTASDDGEDNMFDSVICLDYTSGSHSGSCDNMAFTSTPMQQRRWANLATSPISHDAVRIRTGKKRSRDRPWSAIEFYDGKNAIDMKPICTSESAIDLLSSSRLGNHSSSSNPSPFSTFPRPRAKARGNFRRTNSVGEQNGKSTDSVGAKRRLAYAANTSVEGTSQSEDFSETSARIVNSGEMIRSDSVKSEQEFLSSRTEDLLQQMENARIKSSDSESENNGRFL